MPVSNRNLRKRLAKQSGLAMVTVLWAIAVLSIMAGSFSLSLQRDNRLVKFNEDRAKGAALADAAVHYAALKVIRDSSAASMGGRAGGLDGLETGRWRTDGFPCQITDLPAGQAEVRIFDEAGKVNLNALADPGGAGLPTLKTLLAQVFDGDQDRADRFADAILDWTDQDEFTRPNGAEAEDYQRADKGYVPQNRKFEALEELLMVMVDKDSGETLAPKHYKRLEPLLTVYAAGGQGVNINKASRQVLSSLPLQCMDSGSALQHWQMRGENCMETPQLKQQGLASQPVSQLTGQQAGGVQCAQGNGPPQVFTVYASARTEEGLVTTVRAVISRRQNVENNGSPFTFLSWKQLPSAIVDEVESDRGVITQ